MIKPFLMVGFLAPTVTLVFVARPLTQARLSVDCPAASGFVGYLQFMHFLGCVPVLTGPVELQQPF